MSGELAAVKLGITKLIAGETEVEIEAARESQESFVAAGLAVIFATARLVPTNLAVTVCV